MTKLGVNIDHVASLRELRKGLVPEPILAALVCEHAGADSIVAHLREDRRHIKEKDLILLKKTSRTRLNLEMSTAADIVAIACKTKPDQATLVPEKRKELTTEGGLDVIANFTKTKEVINKLKNNGISVSLFIDPQKNQIDAALRSGAEMIELHTGRYADAQNDKKRDNCFKEIKEAALYAKRQGLIVNAGHGLNYSNVSRISGLKEIEELNIGYSIICRAVFCGLERAVKEMKALI